MRGPLGRYGGPSLVPIVGSVGVLVALCGLVLFLYFGSIGGRDTPQGSDAASGTETYLPPPPTVALPSPGATPATVAPTPSPSLKLLATLPPVQTPSPSTTTPTTPPPTTPTTSPTTTPTMPAAAPVYYKNCNAVRRAGLLVLLLGQPGYSARLDPDGDGIACDRRRN